MIISLKYIVVFLGVFIVNCNVVPQKFFDIAYFINSQIESINDCLAQSQGSLIQEFSKSFSSQIVIKRNEKEINHKNSHEMEDTITLLYPDSEVQSRSRNLENEVKEVSEEYKNKEENDDNQDQDEDNTQNTKSNDDKQDKDEKIVDRFYDEDDIYLQYYINYSRDEQLQNYYSSEYTTLEKLYQKNDYMSKIDEEYKVPSDYIYKMNFKNQNYKIVKLQEQCNNPSQKIVQKRYIYICDSKKVFIFTFLRARNDPIKSCYKQVAYFESCLCPQDRYGIFCTEQVKIDCQFSSDTQLFQNKSQTKNSQENQNPQKMNGQESLNEEVEIFTDKMLNFDSEQFNFSLRCQNHESIISKLNDRFKQIDGLCPQETKKQNGCYIQRFNYTYEDKQNNLLISDQVSLKITLSIANWRIISQPYIIDFVINNSTQDMMTGKSLITIPISTNKISELYPKLNIDDFFQSGKMWYTLQITIVIDAIQYKTYEIKVQQLSGIIEQKGYQQSKLNYYQLLLINKWSLTDYIIIILTILVLVGLISLFIQIFNRISKKNLFHKCLKFITKQRKSYKKRQQDMEMTSDVQYNAFKDETKV